MIGKHVEKFKDLVVVFVIDERENKESARIGIANTFLCKLYYASCHKTGSLNHLKVVSFEIGFASILTCGHESYVMTVQEVEWGLDGVKLHDEVCCCATRETLNVETLLRIERSQLHWFGHVT